MRLKRSDSLMPPMGDEGGDGANGDGTSRKGERGRTSQKARGGRNREGRSRQRSERERSDSGPLLPQGLFSGFGAAVGGVMTAIAWAALGLICALIVWLIVRAIMNYERKPKHADGAADASTAVDEPEQAPGETPADVFVARARELAAQGKYREAISQLLLGAMSRIEQAGLIRFRRGLTYRDYVRAVRSREPAWSAMRGMVRTYEPIGFGRRDATHELFEQTLTGYETGFRATLTTSET